MLRRAILHKKDEIFVTAAGFHFENIQLPGLLYATFARSAHAAAYVRDINGKRAREVARVVAVISIAAIISSTPDKYCADGPGISEAWG